MSTFGFDSSSKSEKVSYATPPPGDKWWESAERGKDIMSQWMAAMFGTDPNVFKMTGGGGPGAVAATGGGPGMGGIFGHMNRLGGGGLLVPGFAGQPSGGGIGGGAPGGVGGQFKGDLSGLFGGGGALGEMLKSLGGGYDTALGGVKSFQDLGKRDALAAGQQNIAAGQSDLQRRGLGNSTVMQSYRRGASYDTQKALQEIDAAAAGMRGELEVGRGQALASGQQFGIGQMNDAMMKLMAMFAGTGGYGPSGWNALFKPGGQPQVSGTKSKSSGFNFGFG